MSPPASNANPVSRTSPRLPSSSLGRAGRQAQWRRRVVLPAGRPKRAGSRRMALNPDSLNSYRTGPDERGHFGIFGGRFVAETLMPLIHELEQAYAAARADPAFQHEMDGHLAHYVGRPSPLYFAERLTRHLGGAKIYLKREELNHTGAHKINNTMGQILLARRMGKRRII